MKQYRVMKKSHSIGHHALPYGGFVTAYQLDTTDEALRVFVDAGILKEAGTAPAPEPDPAGTPKPRAPKVSGSVAAEAGTPKIVQPDAGTLGDDDTVETKGAETAKKKKGAK